MVLKNNQNLEVIMKEFVCYNCGKVFRRKQSEVRTSTPCCSVKCSSRLRTKLVGKQCPVCKKDFAGRGNTCSRACFFVKHSSWVKENQSGTNNPFYGKRHTEEAKTKMSKAPRVGFVPHNKGKRQGRYKVLSALRGRKWTWIRTRILERDGFTCVMCGNTAQEVHHILPLVLCLKHEDTNLVSLCRECHKLTYGKEHLFESYFRGIVDIYYANGENPEVDNPVRFSFTEKLRETDNGIQNG